MISDLQLTLHALDLVVLPLSPQRLKGVEVEVVMGQARNSQALFFNFIVAKIQLLIKNGKQRAIFPLFLFFN